MIDIENELFSLVSGKIREKYPDAVIKGEYDRSPSRFPFVSFLEVDNSALKSAQDTSNMENYASLLYEINVYSNKTRGKKSECRAISALIDEQMQSLGFTRTFYNPIPNEDSTIYRMVLRYTASVSNDKIIYRR